MKIKVLVKPNARTNQVMKMPDGSYSVRLSVPPIEGRANKELLAVLAEYFDVSKSSVSIKSGFNSRIKILEINR
jgi:uncharacterized protein (TIGR00251 family)